MRRKKLTTAGRIVIFVLVLAIIAGLGGAAYYFLGDKIPGDRKSTRLNSSH